MGVWAEVYYISRTEIAAVVWTGTDHKIREFYRNLTLERQRRPTSLLEANAYLASAFKDEAELWAEAVLDTQVQAEAWLRRYETTGILDYNEAYEALRGMPSQEAREKVAAWWARNPGPDDPSIVADEDAL